MGNGIPCPRFMLELDALEVVNTQVCFDQVTVFIIIEGVQLVNKHIIDVAGIALLRFPVVVYRLQVIVTGYDSALVEHYGTHGL